MIFVLPAIHPIEIWNDEELLCTRGADFLIHEKFRIVEWIHSAIDPIPVTLGN